MVPIQIILISAIVFIAFYMYLRLRTSLLDAMTKYDLEAPTLRRYLERHLELGAASREGRLAERLAQTLCAGDPDRLRMAQDASLLALHARLDLWDAVDEIFTRV